MLKLILSPRLWPLLVVQFGGAYNDNLFKQSLMVMIVFSESLRGDIEAKWLLTIGSALFILPYVIFSALAGELADRYEKAHLVRIIKWVELVLMALVALGFLMQELWLLMAVLFAMGTQSAFFSPLKYSLLPDYLRPEELLKGNAILEASTFLSILLGNLCGALLITLSGGGWIVGGILLAVALLGLAASYKLAASGPFNPELRVSRNIIASSFRLSREVFATTKLARTILAISWFWFVGAVFLGQFPLFARHALGGSELIVALMLGAFTIGIALGSFAASRYFTEASGRRYGRYFLMVMGLMTLLLYAASLSVDTVSPLWAQLWGYVVFAALLLIAVAGGLYVVPLNTHLQRAAPTQMRARIVGVNNIVNALLMALASVAIALLYAVNLTVMDVFFWLGVGNLVLSVYIWVLHRNRGETYHA